MSGNDTNGARPHYLAMNRGLFSQRTAHDKATHLIPHLKPNFHILDVGCGPGSITLDLAGLVPDGFVVGIDVIEESINTAKTAAEARGINNAEFHVGNVRDLGNFAADSFDVVHAHQVLLHVPNAVDAFREMRRVIKPGGILSTRDNAGRSFTPYVAGVAHTFDAFDRLCKNRGTDADLGLTSHILAITAGFLPGQVYTSAWAWEIATAEERTAWVAQVKNGAREALVKAEIATEQECDEMAEGWEEWGRDPTAKLMMLDGALLCIK